MHAEVNDTKGALPLVRGVADVSDEGFSVAIVGYLGAEGFSGAGIRAVRHASHLAREGLTTRLISGIPSGSPVPEALTYYGALGNGASVVGRSYRFLRIIQQLRQWRTTVIHLIPASSTDRALLLHLARIAGVRTIAEITLEGSDDPASVRQKRFGSFRANAMAGADRIVCVSPRLVSLCGEHGIPEKKIALIPNDVDAERFRPVTASERGRIRAELGIPNDKVVAVYVGAVAPRKDVAFLVDRLLALRKRHPQLHLVIVGPADRCVEDKIYADDLRTRIVSQGAGEDVHFRGMVQNVEAYLQAADLFWFASKAEGFPSSVIQAMACGLPVVVNRLPGITDYIIGSEKAGFQFQGASEFESRVNALLANIHEMKTVGQRARDRVVSRFSSKAVMSQYLELYRQVVKTDRTHGLQATHGYD